MDLISLEGGRIVQAVQSVTSVCQKMMFARDLMVAGLTDQESAISEDDLVNLGAGTLILLRACQSLELVAGQKAAERTILILREVTKQKKPLDRRRLYEIAEAANRMLVAITDELAGRSVFMLEVRSMGHFEQPSPPWGEEIDSVFRSDNLSEDMREAGKCLALNRPTAAVFHLMRVMEAAVTKLAAHLGIESIAENWGVILSQIDGVTKTWPKRHPSKKPWEEGRNFLFHVKEAWRNETMHPKKTYTEEEAREVFDAVKTYMRCLARLLHRPLP
jgi:hypothetical protein